MHLEEGNVQPIYILYGALAVTAVLFVARRSYGLVALSIVMFCLNSQYGILPVEENIRFFISVFDLPMNTVAQVLGPNTSLPGMAQCTRGNEDCSFLSYDIHPAWGVAFYDRFTLGSAAELFVRNAKLYAHVWPNSIALLLALLQLHPGLRKGNPVLHRWTGRLVALLNLTGTVCAFLLGIEHSAVDNYGQHYAVYGWYVMITTVLSCLIAGLVAAWRGDYRSHEKWMIRWYGSMWGSFFIFRAWILLAGPFMMWSQTGNILCAIYLSAPAGVVVAELLRQSTFSKISKVE